MTVLVTGATGFVGESLCLSLMDNDYEVRAIVRRKNKAVLRGIDQFQIDDMATHVDWSGALNGVKVIFMLLQEPI